MITPRIPVFAVAALNPFGAYFSRSAAATTRCAVIWRTFPRRLSTRSTVATLTFAARATSLIRLRRSVAIESGGFNIRQSYTTLAVCHDGPVAILRDYHQLAEHYLLIDWFKIGKADSFSWENIRRMIERFPSIGFLACGKIDVFPMEMITLLRHLIYSIRCDII